MTLTEQQVRVRSIRRRLNHRIFQLEDGVLPQATRAMSRDWEERWWAWARASWDRATDDNSGEVAFNILKEIWQNKRAVKEHHGISGF